jgi:hypothetical protein
VINDSPGFIAQRIVAHIVNVGCQIAQRRIAAPADIDKGARLGLSYPHGPLAWGDRIGPARVLFILERLAAFYGAPRSACRCSLVKEEVDVEMSFERLFHPRGIAIIGASADPTRIGGHPLRALQRAGYKGGIFPVNPRYPEIAGLTCFPTCTAIKSPCDVRHRSRAGRAGGSGGS